MLLCATLALAFTELPFERLESGHIALPVTLGGYTSPFFLDTGASVTVIRPSTWREAGRDPNRGVKINAEGAGGSVAAVRAVVLPTLTIAGTDFDIGAGVVMEIGLAEDAEGLEFGGILGADWLRPFVSVINFDTNTLRLYEAGEAAPDAPWVRTRRLLGGLTGVMLDLGGSGVTAVVDIGANMTVLNPLAAALPGVTAVPGCQTEAGGAQAERMSLGCVEVPAMILGNQGLPGGLVQTADLSVFEVLRLHRRPAAILGLDQLGTGSILLDPRRRRIAFF